MEIHISGRHFHVSDALKEHVADKIKKLEKYTAKLEAAHIIFEVQKFVHTAEITVFGKQLRFAAKEESVDTYAAFDDAYESMKLQLVRHHEKTKDHKARRYGTEA